MSIIPSDGTIPRSTPEEQGLESQRILAFLDALEAGRFNPHSLMLVRHASVIAEGWWFPYDPGCRRYLYSLSKSFTSTAVGFAVKEQRLSVDDRVLSFFPDDLPAEVSANLRAMRARDLLTMTSGHAIDSAMLVLPRGLENWVQAFLSVPVDYPPGSHFLYDTGASYLLSAIVQKVTGQTVLDYLTERFFDPLGISGATWDTCPRGINTGGWGLSLKTEDLTRFGLFHLHKGSWDGRPLLPSAWVEEATGARVRNDGEDRLNEPVDWRQGYGYQFWRCQHGAYRADGAAGQFCIVMPEQDAVLVITSETGNMQGILDLVWEHLLPAMKETPLPPQAEAQEGLRLRLASLHMDVPARQSLPAWMAELSGRPFKLDANGWDAREVSFTFEQDGCHFRLWDGNGEHKVRCGNGAWAFNEARLSLMQPSMPELMANPRKQAPVRVAAHGRWMDPRTYIMTWQYLETPHSNTVRCTFEAESLQMEVASSMADPTNPFWMGMETRLAGKLPDAGSSKS